MEQSTLKIKYKKHPFLTVLCIVILFLSILILTKIKFTENPAQFVFLILVICFFLIILIFITYIPFKDFCLLVKKDELTMIVDGGFRKKKQLDLSKVTGIASQIATYHYRGIGIPSTTINLQFRVSPKVWGEYYQKNNLEIEMNESNFEVMFITINLNNIKKSDFQQLLFYLGRLNIGTIDFQKSFTGKYQGILREEKAVPENELFKKIRRKQWFKLFFTAFLIFLFTLNFLIHFVGYIYGIFW